MKQIPGFSRYKISVDGKVLSTIGNHGNRRDKILKSRLDKDGYETINIVNDNGIEKTVKVHRLVAFTYIKNKNPELYSKINHLNGIRNDNRVENLEWCDDSINQRHAFRVLKTRSGKKGIEHFNCKLKESDVIEIRKMHNSGLSNKEIAKKFNISRTNVFAICKKQLWKHIV